jgi:hypothetical protein
MNFSWSQAFEQDGQWFPVWTPSEGAYIAGRRTTDQIESDHPHIVIEVEKDEGEPTGQRMLVWTGHVVLAQRLQELDPQPGERLGIRYVGERNSGNGRTYKQFHVVMPDRGHDWEPDTGDEEIPEAESSEFD